MLTLTPSLTLTPTLSLTLTLTLSLTLLTLNCRPASPQVRFLPFAHSEGHVQYIRAQPSRQFANYSVTQLYAMTSTSLHKNAHIIVKK